MKVIKIAGIGIAVLLALLLILPIAFKGPIESRVRLEINRMLQARVEYNSFSLSLFKGFPNLKMSLDELRIVGVGPFEKDTLLAVSELAMEVNPWSAFSGNLKVKSIQVIEPRLHAIALSDTLVNWDIVKPSELETDEPSSSGSGEFHIQLESFVIQNGMLRYSDATMPLTTEMSGIQLSLSGDMSASNSVLRTNAAFEKWSLEYDKVKYFNAIPLSMEALIEANTETSTYTFKENELLLSGIPMTFEGWVQLKDSSYVMDLKLAARQTGFKTLLALVPEMYMKDYANVKADGSLSLQGTVKGEYIDTDHLPAFDLVLNAQNGKVQYPGLPESIEQIFIDLQVKNPGGSADATVIELNKLEWMLAGNPFAASLQVVTPVSNAEFQGKMNGTINLKSLKNAIPLEETTMEGTIQVNASVAANYKMIEQEAYEQINANGTLSMRNFSYTSKDFPQGVTISDAQMTITPRFLAVNAFHCQIGQSDFSLTGRVENYLSYALKNGTLKGKLVHHSNKINSNEFLTDSAPAQPDSAASEPMQIVEVPKNIDFELQSTIGTLLYDKLTLNQIAGKILVKEGKVVLDGLRMDGLKGKMELSGQYNTQNMAKPFMSMDMNLIGVDIHSAVNSFSVVDSILPVAKHAFGKVSTRLNLSTVLGKDFSPVISTLGSQGNLKSEGVEVTGAKFQQGLATALKNDKYKTLLASDLNLNFKIDNGNLIVAPFYPKIQGKQFEVSGRQGLDQSMDYRVKMPLTRKELASLAGLMGLNMSGEGDDLPIEVNIKGNLKNPEISLNLDEAKKMILKEAGKELEKEAEKAVDKVLKDPALKKEVDNLKKKLEGFLKQ